MGQQSPANHDGRKFQETRSIPKWRALLEAFAACQLIFLLPAVYCLYIKSTVVPNEWMLAPWGSFHFSLFFTGDLMAGILVLPAAAVLITSGWRPPIRWGALSAASILLVLLLDLELHAYNLLGNFVAFRPMLDGLSWGVRNIEFTHNFVTMRSVVRLLVSLGAVLACRSLVARWHLEQRLLGSSWARSVWAGTLFVILTLPWAVPAQQAAPSRCVLLRIWSALTEEFQSEGRPQTLTALRWHYRQLTASPEPGPGELNFGSARDSDVIFFVMETTPARCLDLDSDMDRLPWLARLRSQAWIGLQHYTTFPFTSRAHFSVLTSMYPPEPPHSVNDLGGFANGILPVLRSRGYATAAYGSLLDTLEEPLFRSEGVSLAPTMADPGYAAEPDSPGTLKVQIAHDEGFLDSMMHDISDWIDADRHYAVLYAPQLGHGPWVSFLSGPPKKPVDVCRERLALEDNWLGKIIRLLDRKGRLNRTIILVTADHGVREPEEDPVIRSGMVDDYSFHVPLLLYAPAVLHKEQEIPWLTSHIDLEPSMLDLLGIEEGRKLEQGTAIWNAGLGQRATYFWAGSYFGAYGFHSRGKFFMWNRNWDAVYAREGLLAFRDQDLVPRSSSLFAWVKQEINSMDMIRRSWLRCAKQGCDDTQGKRGGGHGK